MLIFSYSLLKHQQTIKHQANLESGSSYAKLQASPAVANAYFREEWKSIYPWVTVDPSGNPGLAYCTVCCKSLTAKKYILGMHQQKAKHIKRAGLTPEEVGDLMKKTKLEKDLDGMNFSFLTISSILSIFNNFFIIFFRFFA